MIPALAAAVLVVPLLGAGPASFEPTDRYESREVEGWPVLVHKALLKDEPKLAADALEMLRQQLYQVTRNVPAPAVSKLRQVRIWVEENEPHHPCMAYHPDACWLRDHGMNPDKARCVEVANARTFLSWTKQQPWMVLHELAHAYHDQFLDDGFGNAPVAAAYRQAIDSKSYESVLHYDGRDAKAYATTNPMEYFAEASEAYFGVNDFYPFVRAELKRHDPDALAVLRKLWGDG